jgi:branched-subunit amino acid transport protein AzlD
MSVEAQDLLLPSAFYFEVPCILEENNLPVLISGLCNTLKLAIFSLYVIYVLRLINIMKYEIFFLKFAEIYWLHFYREAMLPSHPCTLRL